MLYGYFNNKALKLLKVLLQKKHKIQLCFAISLEIEKCFAVSRPLVSPGIVVCMYVVTPILEGLRPPQNLQNWRVCVLYAKTPKSEVLHPPQKLQNLRFCVVLKILVIIFNTPKLEVLRTIRKNSKNRGFAPTAKTPKSEVLRSFKNISNNI